VLHNRDAEQKSKRSWAHYSFSQYYTKPYLYLVVLLLLIFVPASGHSVSTWLCRVWTQ